MNSVERVKAICKERKIPIARLERDLGFANAYIAQLRKGEFPGERLHSIADYLGVSVDYLLYGEERKKEPAAPKGSELAGRISILDADLQKQLVEFVALAQEHPEIAKRHLAFAVGELRSASQGR